MPAPSRGRAALANQAIKQDRANFAVNKIVQSIPRENLDLTALIKGGSFSPQVRYLLGMPQRNYQELQADLMNAAAQMQRRRMLNQRYVGEQPYQGSGPTGFRFNPNVQLDPSQIIDQRAGWTRSRLQPSGASTMRPYPGQ